MQKKTVYNKEIAPVLYNVLLLSKTFVKYVIITSQHETFILLSRTELATDHLFIIHSLKVYHFYLKYILTEKLPFSSKVIKVCKKSQYYMLLLFVLSLSDIFCGCFVFSHSSMKPHFSHHLKKETLMRDGRELTEDTL